MPAAAVIPALIVYTKIAAVKKLVVGFWRKRKINDFFIYLFFEMFWFLRKRRF